MFLYLLLFVPLIIAFVLFFKYQQLSTLDKRWFSDYLTTAISCGRVLFKRLTIDQVWDEQFAKLANKSKTAFHYVDDKIAYSWQQVEEASNQIGHFLIRQNVPVHEVVGVMIGNKPQFFWSWLGITKIGARAALINNNLRKISLIHALVTSKAKILIFDPEFTSAIEEILPNLKSELPDLKLFVYSGQNSEAAEPDFAGSLTREISTYPTTKIPDHQRGRARGTKAADTFLYIYTSGTTGPSKAAKISHFRFVTGAAAFVAAFEMAYEDQIYVTLPLYHSSATILSCGALIFGHSTIILRKKFSASRFFADVREYQATIVLYIGELCRYLINTPVDPQEKNHRLRLAAGNGLRPDVWKVFQERFQIPRIMEFYAATEAPVALANYTNKLGGIGYFSPFVSKALRAQIVKYDFENDTVIRDAEGKCIPVGPNEPGELIGQIFSVFGADNFAGYTNEEATQKKIYRDVFKKGDKWFRSGDLVKYDTDYCVYFVDRIGDTFRWKGENCSTNEVSEIISTFSTPNLNLSNVNVYGALVPDHEGRAGMAAITLKTNDASEKTQEELIQVFDFAGFTDHLKKNLPSYAVPLFLRFVPDLATTSTFKILKTHLRDEGMDIKKIPSSEPVYFLDPSQGAYVPLTETVYNDILSKKIRL